jgi:hypothetical protein
MDSVSSCLYKLAVASSHDEAKIHDIIEKWSQVPEYLRKNVLHANHEMLFRIACRHNNIPLARFWLGQEKKYGRINIHIDTPCAYVKGADFGCEDDVFATACEKGFIDILELIISLEPTHGPVDFHKNSDDYFHAACDNYQLTVAKWLIAQEPRFGKIDINVNDGQIFKELCSHEDRTDMLEYLVSLEATHGKMDIHTPDYASASIMSYEYLLPFYEGDVDALVQTMGANNHEAWDDNPFPLKNYCGAFIAACESLNIRIMDFLFNLKSYGGVDIHAGDDYMFKNLVEQYDDEYRSDRARECLFWAFEHSSRRFPVHHAQDRLIKSCFLYDDHKLFSYLIRYDDFDLNETSMRFYFLRAACDSWGFAKDFAKTYPRYDKSEKSIGKKTITRLLASSRDSIDEFNKVKCLMYMLPLDWTTDKYYKRYKKCGDEILNSMVELASAINSCDSSIRDMNVVGLCMDFLVWMP